MTNINLDVFGPIISQIATQIADQAEAILKMRLASNDIALGVINNLILNSPIFKIAVADQITEFLDTPEFVAAVTDTAALSNMEKIAEEAANDAINAHERSEEHNSIEDVINDREFTSAIKEAVDEFVTEEVDVEREIEKALDGEGGVLDRISLLENVGDDSATNQQLLTSRITELLHHPVHRIAIKVALDLAERAIEVEAMEAEAAATLAVIDTERSVPRFDNVAVEGAPESFIDISSESDEQGTRNLNDH